MKGTIIPQVAPGLYVWSENEEVFLSDGFKTAEEALHDAGDHGAEGTVYVGMVERYEHENSISGEDLAAWLVETLSCRASENAGEISDDWPEPSKEQDRELEARCEVFLGRELDRPEWVPSWYIVSGVVATQLAKEDKS